MPTGPMPSIRPPHTAALVSEGGGAAISSTGRQSAGTLSSRGRDSPTTNCRHKHSSWGFVRASSITLADVNSQRPTRIHIRQSMGCHKAATCAFVNAPIRNVADVNWIGAFTSSRRQHSPSRASSWAIVTLAGGRDGRLQAAPYTHLAAQASLDNDIRKVPVGTVVGLHRDVDVPAIVLHRADASMLRKRPREPPAFEMCPASVFAPHASGGRRESRRVAHRSRRHIRQSTSGTLSNSPFYTDPDNPRQAEKP